MRKKLQKLTAIILSLAITVSVLAVAPFTVVHSGAAQALQA